MNDLQITIIPAQIKSNFEEIRAELQENIKAYDIEVTAENLPDAKKMATDLNKLSGEIDKKRKEKAKEMSEPVKAFEAEAKELTTIIQNARTKILEQVKTYEDKTRELCLNELNTLKESLYASLEVAAEYQTAEVSDLAIASNLTSSMNLSKKAREEVEKRVNDCKARQDMVNSRLANLENVCKYAGLVPAIQPEAIKSFITEPESVYNERLAKMIDGEIARQKAIEERMKAEIERKEKEAAENAARAIKEAELAAERKAQTEIEAEKAKTAEAEKRAQEAEESRRKQAIELALAEMEKEESAKAKEKPLISKAVYITCQIKMLVAPECNQDDAINSLKHICSENNCELGEIKQVIGV